MVLSSEDAIILLSGLADGMVVAHGQSDEYTRGVMDFAEAAARSLGGSLYFFAPKAQQAIGMWEFQKTPASRTVILPGE